MDPIANCKRPIRWESGWLVEHTTEVCGNTSEAVIPRLKPVNMASAIHIQPLYSIQFGSFIYILLLSYWFWN